MEPKSENNNLEPAQVNQFQFPAVDLLSGEKRQKYIEYGVPLYQAALRGDCEAAVQLHARYPGCIAASISKSKETALHIAALEGQTSFVKQILPWMTKQELASQTVVGNTAFCMAAVSGVVEIAEVMTSKNPNLPSIRGSKRMTPLHMAALLGHRDMVRHLLEFTPNILSDADLIMLLISILETDLYDVAMEIMNKYPWLAVARGETGETPLHVLAKKTTGTQFGIWKWFYNTFGSFCGCQMVYLESLELVQQIWKEVVNQPEENVTNILASPRPILFEAIEQGNVGFLTTLIGEYPDLIWKIDHQRRSIFHVAVKYRQNSIFRLIHEIKGIKDLLTCYKDDNENTILHLAALLPTPDRLNIFSGAAFQMQSELYWFEVVKSMVQPQYAKMKNRDGKTPRALFIKEHQELRKDGEKWMRNTATSCMLVATLIAIIVFVAIFTIPSGNNGGNIDARYNIEKKFVIADAVSMLSSTASILMFLAILTSRYAEEDFLRSLPLKLMVGLTLLFISIVSMMVAFIVAFNINLKHNLASISIAGSAFVAATLFAFQQLPLLVDVYKLTISCCLLFRPRLCCLFTNNGLHRPIVADFNNSNACDICV